MSSSRPGKSFPGVEGEADGVVQTWRPEVRAVAGSDVSWRSSAWRAETSFLKRYSMVYITNEQGGRTGLL